MIADLVGGGSGYDRLVLAGRRWLDAGAARSRAQAVAVGVEQKLEVEAAAVRLNPNYPPASLGHFYTARC